MENNRAHGAAQCWCSHAAHSHYGEATGEMSCRECRPFVDETEIPMLMTERRRFERFDLPRPIRTSVGSSPAYVVDASISGIGVMQHQPSPPSGTSCRLMFYSDFGPITLECEVVRTAADRNGATFQTGLRIVAADNESEARLRTMVLTLAVPAAKPSGH